MDHIRILLGKQIAKQRHPTDDCHNCNCGHIHFQTGEQEQGRDAQRGQQVGHWQLAGTMHPGLQFGVRHRQVEVEEAVEAALDKHICRCTGYVRYYHAVRDLILATPGLTTGKRSKEVVNNG